MYCIQTSQAWPWGLMNWIDGTLSLKKPQTQNIVFELIAVFFLGQIAFVYLMNGYICVINWLFTININ